MIIAETISKIGELLASEANRGKTIGFVPTMGALHQGHLSLIRQAAAENEVVVASIFVNPIQFNNPEDLKKYPRTLEADVAMLESAGCHYLFYPTVAEMYPEPVTKVYKFGELDKVMEGAFRPGHFNGVAVVVHKLFDIVKPCKAYFGLKDFQQLAIVQQLVKNEQIPVKIVRCPIVREPDGLAMSSRNVRLGPSERALAPFIFKTLQQAVQLSASGTVESVIQFVQEAFGSQAAFTMEYFNVVDGFTLIDVKDWTSNDYIVGCIAVHLGGVRLIDNVVFKESAV
jgi:pantoate--beta-alanine ligase